MRKDSTKPMASSKAIFACVFFLAIALRAKGSVYVMYPGGARVSFESQPASFGPPFPPDGLMGKLVYPTPHNACAPVTAAPASGNVYEDWFALVDRGGCSFDLKILNCQNANYQAVLVANFAEAVPEMGGSGDGIIIPSAAVSFSTGSYLKENALSGPELLERERGRGLAKMGSDQQNVTVQITSEFYLPWNVYLIPFSVIVGLCVILTIAFVVVKMVSHRRHVRRWRLPKANLKKIPVRKFRKGIDDFDTCAICLDEYSDGEKIRLLPCHHVFHSKCVDPWLTRSKRQCPVCKRRILDDGTCEIASEDQSSMSEMESSIGSETNSSAQETTPLIQSTSCSQSYNGTNQRRSLSDSEGEKEEEEDTVQPEEGSSPAEAGGGDVDV